VKTPLLICCVSVVVVIGYLAVFFIIQHTREMNSPRPIPPAPNFNTTTINYQNEQGKTVERERQFEVSTEMVKPEVLKMLPSAPSGAVEVTPVVVPEAGAK